ncbi:MAG: shikimate dehydrogenase [Alphaproteobacteria bacterium]|nr:shikimate dehydrogenase [Alphaproteobacteria bacterium]
MKIAGATRLAGIMGWPVTHSRSPSLHGFWLEETGTDGAYVPLPVRPEHIEQALRALPVLGFRGCNLTIPHKQTALHVADRVEPLARRIGAVNTIIVAPDGTLEACNTDMFGFRENLREVVPDWSPAAGPAIVLGAGGSARAVVAALTDAGVTEIRIVNRTIARAENVARDLETPATRITVHLWSEVSNVQRHAGLLVNTTSLGMTGEPPLVLDLVLPPTAPVVDIVYVPLETDLLTTARRRGNPGVDGLGMLLHQGRPGFEAWFGASVRVTPELRAAVVATLLPP